MGELQTNGYLTCTKCNALNRVAEIGKQGIYTCGTCQNNLLIVNKEKKGTKITKLLIASFFVVIVGSFGIDQLQERIKPSEINYSKLNTNWTDIQIEHFDRKCKAEYSMNKSNWSSEKIAKLCTCYVSYIVERTDYPRSGILSNIIATEGFRECH